MTDFVKKYKIGETVIVDVRSADEYLHKHIPHSINIPADQLRQRLNEIPKTNEVFVICQSGIRSSEACGQLEALGFSRFSTIEGGLHAFEKSGGQVVKGTTTIPIMRQVQIAAGSLVVLGILLSRLVHPAFIFISVFVGCGLIFAGVSGFCGMALLLAKMPWNRKTNGAKSSCQK